MQGMGEIVYQATNKHDEAGCGTRATVRYYAHPDVVSVPTWTVEIDSWDGPSEGETMQHTASFSSRKAAIAYAIAATVGNEIDEDSPIYSSRARALSLATCVVTGSMHGLKGRLTAYSNGEPDYEPLAVTVA